MKVLRTIVSTCVLAVATSASAQFINSGNNASGSSSTPFTDGTNGAYLSYDISSIGNMDLNGLSAGYLKDIALSGGQPVFLEVGGNLQWAYYNDDEYIMEEKVEATVHLLSVNIPVNLAYQFDFDNNFSLRPFAGINMRGNLLGYMEASAGGYKEDGSIFDEDDMGGEEATRFNIGWKIGARLGYRQFFGSISYGSDFNDFVYNEKMDVLSISLGLKF